MTKPSHIALIGTGVMGQNLALNLAGKGFTVTAWDHNPAVLEAFLTGPARDSTIRGADNLPALLDTLASPRKLLLMVPAGEPVDHVIDQLLPLLAPGDILIDAGNAHYTDTQRRQHLLSSQQIHFLGIGISGGARGALEGPAIMPGGDPTAWPMIEPILQAIAAKVDDTPCCHWLGPGGAGHFVKMVHNGIEYADMQLIGEAYHLMHTLLALDQADMAAVFTRWNQGELAGYLMDITARILAYKEDGDYLLPSILDSADQKGTGRWTAITAMELGVPLSSISEAVFARCLSAQKDQRVKAAAILPGPNTQYTGDKTTFLKHLEQALLAGKIAAYAQGFALLQQASREYNWHLDCARIARDWRGGCIIRCAFLDNIAAAFDHDPDLDNLMLDDWFKNRLNRAQPGWRETVASAVSFGIPCPVLAAGLGYYDGYRSAQLPANLLQAQRDYFGSHGYELVDNEGEGLFHTDWL